MLSMAQIRMMLPQWTKRVLTDAGGRDPLGLSRVSNIITDFLLTGIITTTDQARYYSFYCWSLWHIRKEERPQKYKDFVDAFRRREAAFALATLAQNPNASPVGIRVVSPQLHHGQVQGSVNCDFRVLPSNELGGYGHYYEGSLRQLGLIYLGEDGIHRVHEGIAEKIAVLFHDTIQQTPYIKKHLFEKPNIDIEDLESSKTRFTLDALPQTFAKHERQKLIELFFGFNEKSPGRKTVLRRQTLTLILHLISEYERHGAPVNLQNRTQSGTSVNGIDWYLVYAPYYYRVLSPSLSKQIPYKAPLGFDFCLSLWKQFCLHQFLTQALEALLSSVLETISSANSPPTLEEVVTSLQTSLPEIFRRLTGKHCRTPRELLLVYGISQPPGQETSERLQQQFSLSEPLCEA